MLNFNCAYCRFFDANGYCLNNNIYSTPRYIIAPPLTSCIYFKRIEPNGLCKDCRFYHDRHCNKFGLNNISVDFGCVSFKLRCNLVKKDKYCCANCKYLMHLESSICAISVNTIHNPEGHYCSLFLEEKT